MKFSSKQIDIFHSGDYWFQEQMSDSLQNQKLSNRDMFEMLKSVKNDICQMNEIVTQNSRSVEAIKDSLIQITTILQQLTEKNYSDRNLVTCKDPSITQDANTFSLPPAKKEHIAPIVECESNYVGKGGFGTVYGGNYNGQAVAVKRLTQDSHEGE